MHDRTGKIHNNSVETRIYGGWQLHFEYPGLGDEWPNVLSFLLMIIDLPLSLVGDTLTLPLTIPEELGRGSPEE